MKSILSEKQIEKHRSLDSFYRNFPAIVSEQDEISHKVACVLDCLNAVSNILNKFPEGKIFKFERYWYFDQWEKLDKKKVEEYCCKENIEYSDDYLNNTIAFKKIVIKKETKIDYSKLIIYDDFFKV